MTLSSRHESRFAKCCYYCRTITTFLFSHIGLCALVFGYSIIGAFTFRAIEAPNELKYRKIVKQERLGFTDKVWSITQNSSVLKQREWSEEVAKELEKLEKSLVIALKHNGYDGKDETHESSLQWNFFGALLYSIIVITTIGFGNIAPKTRFGKLVTILYAIVGIPLMLLFLSNIGDAMAKSFKFLYWKVCCVLCVNPKKSRKQRRRRRRRRKQRHCAEQIAMQTIHNNDLTATPEPVLYSTIPRTTAYAANRQSNRQSHRISEEMELSSVPIICNIYALQENVFSDNNTQLNSNTFDPYIQRPFSTLPHNLGLASINDTNRSTLTQVPTNHLTNFGSIVRQNDETDYSDESIESDSEIADIPNVPITLCIALVALYCIGGGFLFQFLENWSFLDASYFSFVTLTTIGFGDLVPGTDVFVRDDAQTILGICALYLLFGMALLAMSFNLVKEEVTKKIRLIGTRIGILTKDESDYESD